MIEKTFITPPKKIPFLISLATKLAEKKTGKEMQVPKILAWYPKAAYASGILEAMMVHSSKKLDGRILKLIRIQISLLIGCPFCIDMNSQNLDSDRIIRSEIHALTLPNYLSAEICPTFSDKEIATLNYTRALTRTPVADEKKYALDMNNYFREQEIVMITYTISQVNYWSRMLKGFGVPVACEIKKAPYK